MNYNAQPTTLYISVCDSVTVTDVFGAIDTVIGKVKILVAAVVRNVQEVVKGTTLQVIFANLNNHSSPPGIVSNRFGISDKTARF